MKRWLVWFGILVFLVLVTYYAVTIEANPLAPGLGILLWFGITALAVPISIIRWLVSGKKEKQGQSVSFSGR